MSLKSIINFSEKMFFRTNHKDIIILGTGFLGLTLSVLIRIELATPGNNIFANNFIIKKIFNV